MEKLNHPTESRSDSPKKKDSKGFFIFRRVVILALLIGTTALAVGIFLYLLFANARSGELYFTPSDTVETLSINFPIGNILLSPWDKDYIALSFEFSNRSSSRKEIIAEEKGAVWELKWDHAFSMSDWKSLDLPIFHLQLPAGKIQDLKFRVQDGLVEIDTFTDWTISGFLTSGKIFIHKQIRVSGDFGVGWGSIGTTATLENKVWEKSTGFSAMLETGSDKIIKLRTYMGSLKTETLDDASI